ncbi:GyrI-like domain-containing protein [Paenibacillus rhizovicinus]|uniref:GyrI-like domain-containing protein n=1 Tax=Paenibacillus rhizovicinus TaxID=2704463 RepID=A0A6C0P7W7_9BACL|nr:GyrI-like domain-containing protein [Paenibacillus rhizovicinus]QHW34677.1 GyrI-like domain-containing protein [Paenibacillus rhizovicinus]
MSLQWRTVDKPYSITLHGVSRQHRPGQPYGDLIMELLGHVWTEVRGQSLPNRGLNYVIYEQDGSVFGGVELEIPPQSDAGAVPNLTMKTWTLNEYAYCVHRGPYSGLGRTNAELRKAVAASGRACGSPLIEVYGHWKEDESQLETEIYCSLD